jgi:hypothetical protein
MHIIAAAAHRQKCGQRFLAVRRKSHEFRQLELGAPRLRGL